MNSDNPQLNRHLAVLRRQLEEDPSARPKIEMLIVLLIEALGEIDAEKRQPNPMARRANS